jgi:hypothetical protein
MQGRQANRLTGRTGKEDDIWKENSEFRTVREDRQADRLTRRTGKEGDIKKENSKCRTCRRTVWQDGHERRTTFGKKKSKSRTGRRAADGKDRKGGRPLERK